MGTPIRRETRAYESDTDILSGLFYPAGTGAITGQVNTANLKTAARTATGKITLTFPCNFQKIYFASAKLNMGTPDGTYAQIDSMVQTSGLLVVVIGTYSAAHSAADVPAVATNFVAWELQVKR